MKFVRDRLYTVNELEGRLSSVCNEAGIRPLTGVEVPARDSIGDLSRNCAFLYFQTQKDAKDALQKLKASILTYSSSSSHARSDDRKTRHMDNEHTRKVSEKKQDLTHMNTVMLVRVDSPTSVFVPFEDATAPPKHTIVSIEEWLANMRWDSSASLFSPLPGLEDWNARRSLRRRAGFADRSSTPACLVPWAHAAK